MKGEKGFALLNLLVVVAVSSIIAIGAGVTIVQLLEVTKQSEEHIESVRQAQNLGYWVSEDLINADKVTMMDDSLTVDTEFIICNWKDWETGDIYDARYFWSDPSSLLKRVLRKYTVRDGEGLEINSATTLVSESIYSANISMPEDLMWRLSVEARSGERNKHQIYEINKRLQ